LLTRSRSPKYRIQSLSISADGRRAVSGGTDWMVRVWDVAHRVELAAFASGNNVTVLAVTQPGMRVIAGTATALIGICGRHPDVEHHDVRVAPLHQRAKLPLVRCQAGGLEACAGIRQPVDLWADQDEGTWPLVWPNQAGGQRPVPALAKEQRKTPRPGTQNHVHSIHERQRAGSLAPSPARNTA
jgi:hypothetical protein